MPKYETTAGYVSRADTFAKLLDLLRQAEDQSYILAHLAATESGRNDALAATGWRAIGEMLRLTQTNITRLAAGKFKQ